MGMNIPKNTTSVNGHNSLSLCLTRTKQSLQYVCGITIAGGIKIERVNSLPSISCLQ